MENAIFAEDAISINGGSFELNVRVGDQEGIFADENSEAFVRFTLPDGSILDKRSYQNSNNKSEHVPFRYTY